MALANLANIPAKDVDFSVFSFHNQDEHRRIVDAIQAQKNTQLTLYPLDPLPVRDLAEWAIIHQAAHNDFNAVLGRNGVDLTAVDLHDPGQLASWIRLHFEEHRQAAQLLGW